MRVAVAALLTLLQAIKAQIQAQEAEDEEKFRQRMYANPARCFNRNLKPIVTSAARSQLQL